MTAIEDADRQAPKPLEPVQIQAEAKKLEGIAGQ